MNAVLLRFGVIGRSRAACAAAFLFFGNGFMFANWIVRIPAVKDGLGLSEGTLGLALTAMGVGGILAMPFGGALAARFGSGVIAPMAGFVFALCAMGVGFAGGAIGLAAALFLIGIANGAMDVTMNAQAAAVEAKERLRVMSFCHAMFSLGMAMGTIPAGAFAVAEVSVALHLALLGVPMAAVLGACWLFAVGDPPHEGPPPPAFALPRGPLLVFGAICFCGAIVEGGMNDWIVIYVEDELGAGPASAALAFFAFSAAMFLARLFGDFITEAFGMAGVVRVGMLVAAAGLLLTVMGSPAAAVIGAAFVGVGVAGVFPAVFRAAGRLPGRPAGPSMAAAVTLGYTGFLFGPTFIGFVAEATSLGLALGALVPLTLIAALLAPALRKGE
ncbi:MAG: MFS transporter [Pseudomonadota bacterium]